MKNFLLVTLLTMGLSIVFVNGISYADDASTAPAAQMAIPAAQAQPIPDQTAAPVSGVIGVLQKVNDKIPLGVPGWIMMIATLVIELLMRFMPTAQPRSILLLLAVGLNLIASIFTKSSGLLDSVAQNLKPEGK